jgi:hypothetical protein
MKMDFKRTDVELNIYGEQFKIPFPTEDQVSVLQEKIEAAKENARGILTARREFLVGLGIPEETLKNMEFAHVNQLSEKLMGEIAGKKA